MKKLISLVAVVLGSACSTVCTTEVRNSVNVEVVDGSGAFIEDATVTFENDGVERDCRSFADTYACGMEDDGSLVVRVVHPDYQPAEETVRVRSNSCHVITEELRIELTPS